MQRVCNCLLGLRWNQHQYILLFLLFPAFIPRCLWPRPTWNSFFISQRRKFCPQLLSFFFYDNPSHLQIYNFQIASGLGGSSGLTRDSSDFPPFTEEQLFLKNELKVKRFSPHHPDSMWQQWDLGALLLPSTSPWQGAGLVCDVDSPTVWAVV